MPDINFDDPGTPLSAPKIMALRDSSHAYHKLADIGRKAVAGRVEFIAVHAEKPGFLVGRFCEGYGFFNVHFPREACGELTAEEEAWLSGQRTVIDVPRLLRVNAHQLWLATLIGNPPPSLLELRARLASISPGNLVAEITTAYQRECDEYAVGRLVACRREAQREPEDKARDFYEEAWYLELLNGRLFRWHNASFVRVLESERDEHDADRDWVAGALARHDIGSLAAQRWLKPIEATEVPPGSTQHFVNVGDIAVTGLEARGGIF